MYPHRLFAIAAAALFAMSACGSEPGLVGSSLQPAVPTEGELVLVDPSGTTSTGVDPAPTEAVEQGAPPTVDSQPAPTAPPAPGVTEILVPEVIATYPHDNTAYTQGLEILAGELLESTGRQGHPGSDVIYESDLRRVDIESGEVMQRADAPGTVFAEGLTLVGDELVQLTWKDEVAYYWDATTFELLREVEYSGQGWGLCFDGTHLVMTDGSDQLFFRDPATFELLSQVPVSSAGQPVAALNELECIDGQVWANVYRTDLVVRIDPTSGAVGAIVDASQLGQPRPAPSEVLNGIAWDDETDTWLMTGKFWPSMYRVRFVPANG